MLERIFFADLEGDRAMGENCQSFSVDLSAFFDGELEGEELSAIETHLESCTRCAGELEKMRKLSGAIHRASEGSPVRRPLFQEIMSRLGEEENLDEPGRGGKTIS